MRWEHAAQLRVGHSWCSWICRWRTRVIFRRQPHFGGGDHGLEARIVAVADVFDALISPRPYKKAWDVDAALGYLYAQRGRLFDPRCVDALIRSRERLEDICNRFSTVSARPGLE